MNFWEARDLALLGENVRMVGSKILWKPNDFKNDKILWSNSDLAADWEIVYQERTLNEMQFFEAVKRAQKQTRLLNADTVYYAQDAFEKLAQILFREPSHENSSYKPSSDDNP